ncbi:MAG: hypothetical protein ACLGHZ_04115, partial [Actinomycetes bacterium]
MTDFFSIFQPGHEYMRRQKELEKVLFVDTKKGGRGPQPPDLDSGSITIEMPARQEAEIAAGAAATATAEALEAVRQAPTILAAIEGFTACEDAAAHDGQAAAPLLADAIV